jgi:hypothetical protein
MSTTYFLAGTMQGPRRGAEVVDQGYRTALRQAITDHDADAVIQDPLELMVKWFGGREQQVREAHAALAEPPVIRRIDLSPTVLEIVEAFHRLTRIAADSDVCVAWLPGHEPSMGTAAEMQRAYLAGRTVVAITEMRQNLAVLACSTVILPDLPSFTAWLATEAVPA